jgi:hypothetical protein
MRRTSFRTTSVLACLIFIGRIPSSLAVDCDWSPVQSKNTIRAAVPVMGRTLDVVIHPSWRFEPQPNGLIRIVEVADGELTNVSAVIIPAILTSVSLPHDDCRVNASVDNTSVSPRSPTLVAHLDISATLWTCPGTNVPCPTWKQPLRMCYKRLAKTVLGKGSGWAEVYLTPAFSGNNISLSTTSATHFSVNSGTVFGIGAVLGPLAPALAQLASGFIPKLNFSYPPVVIPASELEPGDTQSNIPLNWQNSNVYFGNVQHNLPQPASTDLVRERFVDEKAGTACYIRGQLSTL